MAETRETRDTQTRSERKDEGRGIQRSERAISDRLARRDPHDVFSLGPFSLMRRMQEDFDRLFGDLWGSGRQSQSLFRGGTGGDWTPAIDAFQRGNEFVIRVDVPGLSPEDLTAEIGDDAVTIQGERKYETEEEREGVFRSERSYGSFARVIPLPEGAVSDSAKANFKNGVLEIVVQAPSQEVRRGRRLEIGRGTSESNRDASDRNREASEKNRDRR